VQLRVHPHVLATPPPPHVSGDAHAWPVQHCWPSPPHVPQLPVPHFSPPPQATHVTPPAPHEPSEVPDSHVLPLQHPAQDAPSHVQTPLMQCWPVPQEPVWHTPPQPSSAPQALPVQLGVHPHFCAVPPPPHVSGALHVPPLQHASPLPPQAVHPPSWHVCVPPHARHAAPPRPHSPGSVPFSQTLPLQHPSHDVASQRHSALEQCWPLPQEPVVQTPPQPSLAPQALPEHVGVHPHTLDVPPPPHESGDAQAPPAQHACPLPPQVPQLPVPHASPPEHATHSLPPLPHCPSTFPGSQTLPLQHPAQDVPSQMHTPAAHRSPEPQGPVWQTPPHPSLAPHALPLQLGVHPHSPARPPPPHVSGALHVLPPQHGCPAPPHAEHAPPAHWSPAEHAAHAPPPCPHAAGALPVSHPFASQQPAHVVASHLQAPATQRSPAPHEPDVQIPWQPSLAPQALPSQLGVHVPVPHAFGAPPAPQLCPTGQPPHEMGAPHALTIWPHLPAQSAATLVEHAPSPPLVGPASAGVEGGPASIVATLPSRPPEGSPVCTSKASPSTTPQADRPQAIVKRRIATKARGLVIEGLRGDTGAHTGAFLRRARKSLVGRSAWGPSVPSG
jgi:hypothetical protein